jgi:ubiquinone biosynthesis protein
MLDDKTDRHKLTSDIEQMLDTYHNFRLKDIPFGMVASQTFELFRNNYVVPPTQFTLMLKSLMTIEAFAISLDPEFRIIEALKPHAKEFQLRDFEPRRMARNLRRILLDVHDLAGRIPDDINAIMHKVRQGKFQMRLHHEHLDDLAKTLDKSSNRISFALIIAALLVASSHLVSEEGTVVGLFDLQTLGLTGYVIAAIIGIWLVISIIRSRHF